MSLKYPSMETYYSAMENADGDPDKCDPRSLIKYLMLFTYVNARLRGHILTRKTAVSSWDWDIIPYNPNDAEKALEAKVRLKNAINTIVRNRVDTVLYGSSLIKFKWELSGKFNVPILERIFRPDEIYAYNNSSVAIFDGSRRTIINNNSPDYIAETDGESVRGGLLRSVGITEIIRYDMLLEWANWSKKQKGIIQGIDKGADDGERKVAEDALVHVLKNNVMLTSDLIEYKFHQIANSTAGDSFKEFLTKLDSSVAVAILGQANTPELPAGGGSRAALQVQQMVSADIMYSDVICATELVDRLLKHDCKLNYNTEFPLYQFKVNLAETVDLEKTASMLELASRFLTLNLDEAYTKLGLTPPPEGAKEVQNAENIE